MQSAARGRRVSDTPVLCPCHLPMTICPRVIPLHSMQQGMWNKTKRSKLNLFFTVTFSIRMKHEIISILEEFLAEKQLDMETETYPRKLDQGE